MVRLGCSKAWQSSVVAAEGHVESMLQKSNACWGRGGGGVGRGHGGCMQYFSRPQLSFPHLVPGKVHSSHPGEGGGEGCMIAYLGHKYPFPTFSLARSTARWK